MAISNRRVCGNILQNLQTAGFKQIILNFIVRRENFKFGIYFNRRLLDTYVLIF